MPSACTSKTGKPTTTNSPNRSPSASLPWKSQSNAKVPRVTAREIIAVLEKKGFLLARQSGSHKIYKDAVGKRVTVPFHAQKVLHPKVLRRIMRDAGIAAEEFERLL